MRHPSRQPSDALQFLSLAQFVFYLGLRGFRPLQSGDVPACSDHIAYFSARVRNQFCDSFRGHSRAVFAEIHNFTRLDARALAAQFHGRSATFDLGDGHPVTIAWHRLLQRLRQDLFRCEPSQLLDRWTHIDASIFFQVPHPDHIGGVLGNQPIPLVGPLLFRNVEKDRGEEILAHGCDGNEEVFVHGRKVCLKLKGPSPLDHRHILLQVRSRFGPVHVGRQPVHDMLALHSEQLFKASIHVQHNVVVRNAAGTDQPVESDPFLHGVEERPVLPFALPPVLLRCLPFGDVDGC